MRPDRTLAGAASNTLGMRRSRRGIDSDPLPPAPAKNRSRTHIPTAAMTSVIALKTMIEMVVMSILGIPCRSRCLYPEGIKSHSPAAV